jgi:hypothetical protein
MKVKIKIEEVYDLVELESLLKSIRKLREQFCSQFYNALDVELEINVTGVQV